MITTIDYKDVFGIKTNKLPLSYIERKDVKARYQDAIKDGVHIILYGGTKQGKTSFLLNHYKENLPDFIRVDGAMTIEDLNGKILKSILMIEGRNSKIPIATKSLDDVRSYLKHNGFEDKPRTIIIENYHYLLRKEYSRFFLEQMRNSIEGSHQINIVLVGIFKDQDITTYINGDLSGRIVSITLEPWSDDLLSQIIDTGMRLIGIDLEGKLKDTIIANSFGNVAILQDLMKNVIEAHMGDRNNVISKAPVSMLSNSAYSSICGKVINNIVGSYGRRLISNLLSHREEKILINKKAICPNVAKYFLNEWQRPSSEIEIKLLLDFFYEDSSASPNPDDFKRFAAVIEKFNDFIMKDGGVPAFFIVDNSILKIMDTYFLFYLNNTLDDTNGVILEISME